MGRRIVVDDAAAARRSDHRIGALEQDRRTALSRCRARPGQPVATMGEHPGKLTLVRGEQAVGVPGGGKQGFGVVAEHGDGVGVQHHRPARRQRTQHHLPRGAVDAAAGSDQHGVLALVFKQRRELRCIRDREHQQPGHVGGINRKHSRRAGDRHHPRPGTHGAARRQPRGAGHDSTARDDRVAATVFMIFHARPGIAVQPQPRTVGEVGRRDVRQHAGRNADIGHHNLSGQFAAGQQQVSGLAAEKSDGQAAPRRDTLHRAGVAIDAARNVDRNTGWFARIHRRDYLPRQPGAEQPVDHEAGAVEHVRRQPRHVALPVSRGDGGIALEAGALAQQHHLHRPAVRIQQAGHHEAVAAIVARAAQHRHRALRPTVADVVRDGPARCFHQGLARHAAGHGGGIGAVHFLDRQQFAVVGKRRLGHLSAASRFTGLQ